MNDVDAERAEPVGRIEPRLAHRAVSLVEQGGQRIALAVVVLAEVIIGDLGRAVILAHAIVVRPSPLVLLVADCFGRRPLSGIPVPRQPSLRHGVLAGRPEAVVRFDRGQRRLEPRAVRRLAVHAQDHAREERRL